VFFEDIKCIFMVFSNYSINCLRFNGVGIDCQCDFNMGLVHKEFCSMDVVFCMWLETESIQIAVEFYIVELRFIVFN